MDGTILILQRSGHQQECISNVQLTLHSENQSTLIPIQLKNDNELCDPYIMHLPQLASKTMFLSL